MRIVFFGSSDTGWLCCRALLERPGQVVGIVTMPKHFRISWSPAAAVANVRFRDFHALGAEFGVPVEEVPGSTRDEALRARLAALNPDLLVVAGWYHLIPRSIRDVARLGAVGVHASLLPRYRGNAPLVWALINGERESGVTLFQLEDGVDDGDIVAQARFDIGADDTIADAVERANGLAVELIRGYVPRLIAGTAPRTPQDHPQATVMPPRRPADGGIDWRSMSAEAVHNWVRAQTRPYPGAFTFLHEKRVMIWCTRRSRSRVVSDRPPGIVGVSSGSEAPFSVVCADGAEIDVLDADLGTLNLRNGDLFQSQMPFIAGGHHASTV